jgi:hypothetical protein
MDIVAGMCPNVRGVECGAKLGATPLSLAGAIH